MADAHPRWYAETRMGVRDPSDKPCCYDLTLVTVWEGCVLVFFGGGGDLGLSLESRISLSSSKS